MKRCRRPLALIALTSAATAAAILPGCAGAPDAAKAPDPAHLPQVLVLTRAEARELFPNESLDPPIVATALTDPQEAQRARRLIQEAMSRYPADVLASSLEKVLVVDTLRFGAFRVGGTYSPGRIYLAVRNHDDATIIAMFHEEMSSILFRRNRPMFPEVTWRSFNPPGFEYLGTGFDGVKAGATRAPVEQLIPQGFLCEYSKWELEEDFNGFASRVLMKDPDLARWVEQHRPIRGKYALTVAFYHAISPAFDLIN